MDDELYHGTVRGYARSIVKDGINVRINKGAELDFGAGFYFSDRETAIRLAYDKQADVKTSPYLTEEEKEPVLVKLDVNLQQLRSMKCLSFDKKDREWFQYVFNTRFTKMDSDHDFIEGPMADGNVNNVMKLYVDHPSSITRLFVWINYMWFVGHGHIQYVAKTKAATGAIHVHEKIEEVE